jgi:ribosomal protein S18 acetylase RimI-like enzyme
VVEIRRSDVERDAELIKQLDTSFATDTIFDVTSDGRTFRLVEKRVDPPVEKHFPLDELDTAGEWENAWLALDLDRPVGVIATQHSSWNQRVVVWHLYVATSHRRQGIARRLLETALGAATKAGARTAWIETSNLNVPGVRAYERLGFELSGLDTTLYDGTPAAGEVALFLSRLLTE